MIPLLVLQILLFPLTANWLMNMWVNSRMTLALNDSASRLGSTIQQLYSALSHATISAGTLTSKPGLPVSVENHHYLGTATLNQPSEQANSSKILTLTLSLEDTSIEVDSSVTLGPHVLWENSTFFSNSTNAVISAQKFDNDTILLKFG